MRFNPRPRRGAGATGNQPNLVRRIMAVSILARAEARALRRRDDPRQLRRHVSILARAEARALPQIAAAIYREYKFQSSPAPRRGRYADHPERLSGDVGFQSSPAPRRGRYAPPPFTPSPTNCFNPRPRRGAGATWRSK